MIREKIGSLYVHTYSDDTLENHFANFKGQLDKILSERPRFRDPVVVFEGDIYEQEIVVYAFRDKTTKELAAERRREEASKRANADKKKKKEEQDRKNYERLKKKFGTKPLE